jgi:hypothetical protein
MNTNRSWWLIASVALCLAASTPSADEGMWTFDDPPLKQLQERYGFTPTKEWLDRVRLSSVRFNDGGSGSFVGKHGLAITNHHVALGQIQKLSTGTADYVRDGFYARTQAEELKCPDLELNRLISVENVTSRVHGAVKPGMNEKQGLDARKAAIARIEKESLDATGLRSDVVSLYGGGEYRLHRYKKYTDVRLVFAPEQQAAFFGGDPDNFTFPRYDLDFAIVRVYENDRPVETNDYLRWSSKGAADGELIFVSGHPGSTQRSITVAELELERNSLMPTQLNAFKRRLDVTRQFSARGAEQARQALGMVFGLENTVKAMSGEYSGLLDKQIFDKKRKEERDLRDHVDKRPELRRDAAPAWDAISRAVNVRGDIFKLQQFRTLAQGSRLAAMARQIVLLVAELKKPDADRLDGYHDSQLESLRFRLFSPAPVYPELDQVLLEFALQESSTQLGPTDPFVVAMLGGRAPAQVAQDVIAGTKLGDAGVRKALVEGGEAAVAASTDPLIVLTRKSEPFFRELRKTSDEKIESVLTTASEKIAKARFAVYGKSVPPDATFTLRLSYGTVGGYPMNGTVAPSKTTFFGLYDRAASFDDKPPFNLTPRFQERRDRLDLSTPLNFVSSADIIGGNSGSPVINRQGEFVGLIFDGNIESLVGNYVYAEETNRAVSVHSAAIVEVLRKIYDAGALADELEGK